MSIYAPQDTRAALGAKAERCESRALFFERFANPSLKEDERKNWFSSGCKISVPREVVSGDAHSRIPCTARPLYARLQSRLMVNMAGGVMENAGLCLDRYGLPLIPGSAVKACARRMALRALHDWIAAGTQRPAPDDACAPCCEGFATPAEMLAAIALVFGWVEQDWTTEKNRDKQDNETTWKSDLAWACDSAAPTGQNIPAQGNALGNATSKEASPEGAAQKVRAIFAAARASLPKQNSFSGSIAFLGAQPNRDPGLELDVVTPHHTNYYAGELSTATDTEEPVPVIFPAVAPQKEGDYFTFPLIPLRGAEDKWLLQTRAWLAHGLELFGIGAKTNEGYGWFDASEDVQNSARDWIKAAAKAEVDRKQLETENAKRRADVEADRVKREQEAAVTAGMSDDEKADRKLSQLQEQQFESKLRNFFKEPKRGGPSENEKAAIIRALRGARLAQWQSLKTKASKGGELAKAEQAIRALCKSMNLGKMP